jgi:hypothetical protein
MNAHIINMPESLPKVAMCTVATLFPKRHAS